jgi:hypothetical protein
MYFVQRVWYYWTFQCLLCLLSSRKERASKLGFYYQDSVVKNLSDPNEEPKTDFHWFWHHHHNIRINDIKLCRFPIKPFLKSSHTVSSVYSPLMFFISPSRVKLGVVKDFQAQNQLDTHQSEQLVVYLERLQALGNYSADKHVIVSCMS